MSPTFPALAFHRDVGRYAEEDLEKLTHAPRHHFFELLRIWAHILRTTGCGRPLSKSGG